MGCEWPCGISKMLDLRGKSGVGDFCNILRHSWQFHSFNPRQFIENHSTVVVMGEETGIDQLLNEPFVNRWVHVFDVKQQRIVCFREFLCHWTGEQQPPLMSW